MRRCRLRSMPHFSAIRSAPSNCDVISYRAKYGSGIGEPSPSFFDEFEPIGTRLINSTPQATATSTTPEPISDVARLVACWLEPHCVSTVVAAVPSGEPGRQPGGAGDVEALFADLAHAAADDLPDFGGVDAGAIDERRLDRSECCWPDGATTVRRRGDRSGSARHRRSRRRGRCEQPCGQLTSRLPGRTVGASAFGPSQSAARVARSSDAERWCCRG